MEHQPQPAAAFLAVSKSFASCHIEHILSGIRVPVLTGDDALLFSGLRSQVSL